MVKAFDLGLLWFCHLSLIQPSRTWDLDPAFNRTTEQSLPDDECSRSY
jgi:hypothetical protein